MNHIVCNLSFSEAIERLRDMKQDYRQDYLAMYSSWYGGIVTDPALMMVPIDDHLVHRGDGVFEAMKCVGWKIYGLQRHLERMKRSLAGLSLSLPVDWPELEEIVKAVVRAGDTSEALIRIFVSRGPGGFSVNPYECPESQVYVIVSRFHPPLPARYEEGVKMRTSLIPMKKEVFANIKSCNYLPNVLMKKEAEDAGVDFTVSLDRDGFMGEGPTENFGLVTGNGRLLVPRFERVLRGTTVTRALELAGQLVASGYLTGMGETNITPAQAYEASEIMMFGTTFDILPVVSYDDHVIGDGKPGPCFRKLLEILREDMRGCEAMLTPVHS